MATTEQLQAQIQHLAHTDGARVASRAATGKGGPDCLTLINNRGVAKREKSKGDEAHYLTRNIKTEAFIFSALPDMDQVLAWAEDQDAQITSADITNRFGTGAADEIERKEDKAAQLHAATQTEGRY